MLSKTNLAIIILITLTSNCFSQSGWFTCGHLDSVELESVYFLDQNHGWIAGSKVYSDSSKGVIYKSTDGGYNWSLLYMLDSSPNNFLRFNGFKDIHFATLNNGCFSFQWGENSLDSASMVFRYTTNAGINWQQNAFLDLQKPSGIFFVDSLHGWFFADHFFTSFIYKTTNSGYSWFQVSGARLNSIFFINENSGWGTSTDGYVMRTFTGGNGWGIQPHAGYYHYDIQFVTNLFGYSLANTVSDSGRMYKTTTGGSLWTLLSEPTGANKIKDFWFTCQDTGYCYTTENKLFKTTNKGLNWDMQSFDLTQGEIKNMLFVNNTTGWICNKNGDIYKTINGGTVNIFQNEIILEDYEIFQNFPNPFNPSTVISYRLKVSNDMKLKVYDVLGNEVATLVNEKKNPGSYSVEFSGEHFSSGVYFYRLEVDGNVIDTKRMVLLK